MSDRLHAPDDSRSPATGCALADEAATRALGAAIAPALEAGLVIYLLGDLGAGKTTLVRGLLEALGHRGAVRSPTYTLIEPYAVSKLDLYHFDFYRFTDPEEFVDAGLEEYFGGQGVCLVEWPDKGAPFVPAPDLEVQLEPEGDGRRASLRGCSERGQQCLSRITLPCR